MRNVQTIKDFKAGTDAFILNVDRYSEKYGSIEATPVTRVGRKYIETSSMGQFSQDNTGVFVPCNTVFSKFELYPTYTLAVRGFERFTLIRDLKDMIHYGNVLDKLTLESLQSIQHILHSNDRVITVAIPDKDYADFADMVERNKSYVPDLEGDSYDECGIVFDTGYCPTCRHKFELDYSDRSNFCPDCGQRLDWSGIVDD